MIELADPSVTREIITIGIIARNEADSIGNLLLALGTQSLLSDPAYAIQVVVFANGCTDQTALYASESMIRNFCHVQRAWVYQTKIGGKSRSWNILVHQLAAKDTAIFLFIDADITFANDRVCADLVRAMLAEPVAVACSGRPTKSFALDSNPSFIRRISLRLSEDSRANRSINGSLYCIRASVAQAIWLPDETPGEDGFLNAMVHTDGFSAAPNLGRVTQVAITTHYYDPGPLSGLLNHERRMIVGTAINIWIFEYLWSLGLQTPAGPLIDRLNRSDPNWVNKLIQNRIGSRYWAIPRQLLFWRLPMPASVGIARFIKRLPLALAATAFNLLACALANGILKSRVASRFW